MAVLYPKYPVEFIKNKMKVFDGMVNTVKRLSAMIGSLQYSCFFYWLKSVSTW